MYFIIQNSNVCLIQSLNEITKQILRPPDLPGKSAHTKSKTREELVYLST